MTSDMPNGNQLLQAWTCVKCGAVLPAEAGTGLLVTCSSCSYCDTPFNLPTAQVRRSGGVAISSGSVFVGGDVVGGSKRIIVTGETPLAATVWDEPGDSGDEGVLIDSEGVQVYGDVVGGSVVRIVRPVPFVQAEPVQPLEPEVSPVPQYRNSAGGRRSGVCLRIEGQGA